MDPIKPVKILATASRVVGKILIFLILAMLLSQVLVAGATVRTAPHDLEKYRQIETFRRVYLTTRRCMFEGSRIMLRESILPPAVIKAFTVGVCSEGLRSYLIHGMGWSPGDAKRLIEASAQLELEAAANF